MNECILTEFDIISSQIHCRRLDQQCCVTEFNCKVDSYQTDAEMALTTWLDTHQFSYPGLHHS